MSKNDKSEVYWSEIPEQAAVQHDQIMHTACIGELNAMHFKQTLNEIINLPQEHSNYTSFHELCPYDVNIARPLSVPFQNQETDSGALFDHVEPLPVPESRTSKLPTCHFSTPKGL